jgi:hypothetical protein
MLTHTLLHVTLCLPQLWFNTKIISKRLVKNEILTFIQIWSSHQQGAGAIGNVKELCICDGTNTIIVLESILWNVAIKIHKYRPDWF